MEDRPSASAEASAPASCVRAGVVLSVDVEEWFHAYEHPMGRDAGRWDSMPRTLPMAVDRALEFLDGIQARATFFILGWVAERHPGLVKKIADLGHEAASHGCRHVPVSAMTREAFAEDARRSRETIEDLAGTRVRGFRAPGWSMPFRAWPYEVLFDVGYGYSSSRLAMPLRGRMQVRPHMTSGVLEIPALSTAGPVLPVPAGGTVSLRSLPLPFLKTVRRRALASGRPAVYWFHPWELVPGGPRLDGGAVFNLVRYLSLSRLPDRIKQLVPEGDRTFRTLLGS